MNFNTSKLLLHFKNKFGLLKILLLIPINYILTGAFVFSQQMSNVEDLLNMSIEELGKVEIFLASRTPKTIFTAPALATVITSEEIRLMGAKNLLDVVKRVPGFNISINNIGNQVIDVRGLKSYHGEKLLLMVDGHRLNELHSGGAAWSYTDIALDNVEKIELIRGPGSALYGENAFAGIINVITKKYNKVPSKETQNTNNANKDFITFGRGNNDTNNTSFMTGFAKDDFAVSLFGRKYETDGESLDVDMDILSLSPFTAQFSDAPGKTEDWINQDDWDLWCLWKNITFHSRYLRKERGPYINITDALSDGSKRVLYNYVNELKFENEISDTLKIETKLFSDQHEWDNYWVGYPRGFLGIPGFSEDGLIGEPAGKFRTNGLEIITQLLNSEINNITVGAGYRAHKQYDIRYWANFNTTSNVPPPIPLSGGYQEVSSWGNWASEPDYHENDWSLYGQDDLAISEKMSVIAGLRYDKYEQFGGVFNPRAGLTYMASDSTALKLLYGRAFRAPSYVERFTMNNPAYVGTPDLDPETVDTIESSVNYILQNFSIELGIYNSKYKDLIVLGEKPSVTEPAPYINKDKATSNGTELTVRNKIFDTLSLMLNFSCQSIKNDSTDEDFPGISKHQGNVELEWKVFNTTFLNTHYYVCCDRERASNDPRGPLEGYELVNISLLSKNIGLNGLDLQISVNNLFDTEYYDPAPVYTIYNDFPRPRINTMVELKYSF